MKILNMKEYFNYCQYQTDVGLIIRLYQIKDRNHLLLLLPTLHSLG